jgi:hypothetical protein
MFGVAPPSLECVVPLRWPADCPLLGEDIEPDLTREEAFRHQVLDCFPSTCHKAGNKGGVEVPDVSCGLSPAAIEVG